MGVVMMDNHSVPSKDGYFDGDIEKGEVNVNTTNTVAFGSGFVSINKEEKSEIPSSDDVSKNGRLVVVVGGETEKKAVKEKAKGMSAKKPPKPPRPPRGLSLDSADQKLIRELHELARLKRARVERMKGLKKAKETKAMSSKNQLFATLLTILFCLVLLLQGMSSRSGATPSIRRFRGPPFSSEVAEQHNTISVQHLPLSSTSTTNHNLNNPRSESPSLVEQVSGVEPRRAVTVSRASGRL